MYNNLFIRIWDVQHGSAAYVRTPEGRHMAIDLGVGDFTGNDAHRSGGDESFSPLKFLRESGVQQLDRVVITHPHTDHVDDIFEFDNLSPKTLLYSKPSDPHLISPPFTPLVALRPTSITRASSFF